MRKVNKLLMIISAVVITLCAAGCNNISQNTEENFSAPTIKIGIAASARTINPTVNLSNLSDFTLKATKQGEDETVYFTNKTLEEITAEDFEITLPATGTYSFTLTAKVNEMIYSGTIADKKIVGGQNQLAFEMEFTSVNEDYEITAEDTGSVNITLEMDVKANTGIYFSLSPFYEEEDRNFETEVPYEAIQDGKFTWKLSDVPAGVYDFKINFYCYTSFGNGKSNKTIFNTYREFVNVSKGLESKSIIQIPEKFDENLYLVRFIYKDVNGANTNGNYAKLTKCYSKIEDWCDFPVGYEFDYKLLTGWKKNSDLSGDDVTKITPALISSEKLFNYDSYELYAECIPYLSVRGIKDYLDTLPENTVDNPYKIEICNFYKDECLKDYEITRYFTLNVPASIIDISYESLIDCEKLVNLTIDEGNSFYVFENSLLMSKNKTVLFWADSHTNKITIPETIESISKGAFYDLEKQEIECPNYSIANLVKESFEGLKRDKDKSNSCILKVKFTNYEYNSYIEQFVKVTSGLKFDIDLTDVAVTEIGSEIFNLNKSLYSIKLPNTLTTIGGHAFSKCYSLTSVKLPENLQKIEEYAFSNCISLSSIDLPNTINFIGSQAFLSCESLKSIVIPEKEEIITIGDSAFWHCKGLETVSIPDNARATVTFLNDCTSLSNLTINIGKLYSENHIIPTGFLSCSKITSIEIPDGIVKIGENAFTECTELTEVKIPSSVTEIKSNAFKGCTGLTKVSIPQKYISEIKNHFPDSNKLSNITICDSEGYETIDGKYLVGNNVLYKAFNLEGEVELPDSITSISGAAFADCTELTKISLKESVVGTDKTNFFPGCTSLETIDITDDVENDYKWEFENGLLWFKNINDKTTVLVTVVGSKTELTIDDSVNISEINENALQGCTKLKKVVFTKEGFSYPDYLLNTCTGIEEIEINFLEEEEKQIITTCASSKGFSLKISEVTEIPSNIFRDTGKIRFLELPDVITIGDSAFYGCNNLEKITLPVSLKSIGSRAFYNTDINSELELLVTYGGTKEDWNKINIGEKMVNGSYKLKDITGGEGFYY